MVFVFLWLAQGFCSRVIFNYEKLIAYQIALEFSAWAGELLERVSKKISACDQLDSASTSAPINIAEGNGKSSLKDRKRFFEITHGSELESASCLDVLHARKLISTEEVAEGKAILKRGIDTLYRLIRNHEKRING